MEIIIEGNRAVIDSVIVIQQVLLKEVEPVVSNIEMRSATSSNDFMAITLRQGATPLTFEQFKAFVDDFAENKSEMLDELAHQYQTTLAS